MLNNHLINLMFETPAGERVRPDAEAHEFMEFGTDILESEALTDLVYSTFLGMIKKGWRGEAGVNKKEFAVSDIGLIYMLGPYIPCVRRIAFSRNVDLHTDGLPGIRVVGLHEASQAMGSDLVIYCIRPVIQLPNDIQIPSRCLRKYKCTILYSERGQEEVFDSFTLWYGITPQGRVLSAYNKRSPHPERWHAAAQGYPSLAMNAWADSRYLWQARTSENIGLCDLRLRLGLDKEHIKSLFYARSLPVTETGRKRPILHWVRAHKRRLKAGIDIDISPYLQGITALDMDGLRFQITQPNKAALRGAEPQTIRQAYERYVWS